MGVEFRVHDMYELLQCRELSLHTALIAQEVLFLNTICHYNLTLTWLGEHTMRFMMATKHQNVNSSSASVTTYTGAQRSDIPCTYPECGL